MAKMSWAVEVAEKMEEVWQKGRQMLAQAVKKRCRRGKRESIESILELYILGIVKLGGASEAAREDGSAPTANPAVRTPEIRLDPACDALNLALGH